MDLHSLLHFHQKKTRTMVINKNVPQPVRRPVPTPSSRVIDVTIRKTRAGKNKSSNLTKTGHLQAVGVLLNLFKIKCLFFST